MTQNGHKIKTYSTPVGTIQTFGHFWGFPDSTTVGFYPFAPSILHLSPVPRSPWWVVNSTTGGFIAVAFGLCDTGGDAMKETLKPSDTWTEAIWRRHVVSESWISDMVLWTGKMMTIQHNQGTCGSCIFRQTRIARVSNPFFKDPCQSVGVRHDVLCPIIISILLSRLCSIDAVPS